VITFTDLPLNCATPNFANGANTTPPLWYGSLFTSIEGPATPRRVAPPYTINPVICFNKPISVVSLEVKPILP
jgi:hypothetical protein